VLGVGKGEQDTALPARREVGLTDLDEDDHRCDDEDGGQSEQPST
jgi:hypothetical protein